MDMAGCRELCIAEGPQCGCWDYRDQWQQCDLYAPYDGKVVDWDAPKDVKNGDTWAGLGEYQEFEIAPTPAPTQLIQYCEGDDCTTVTDAECSEEVFGTSYCVSLSIAGTNYQFKGCYLSAEDVGDVPRDMTACRDLCMADGKKCGCWDFGSPYDKCQLYEKQDGKVSEWAKADLEIGRTTYYAGLGAYQEAE